MKKRWRKIKEQNDDAKPITREELIRKWKNARFKATRRRDFEELGGVFVIIT
jgi:uncharacterized short protein YbdD (DUF466 family)